MKKTKMLKKNYEFKKILTKGKYYTGNQIEAFIKPIKDKEINKLGIAVGVKIAKATMRNHIKRLIRENYRNYESQIKKGNSIIFLWKKKAETKQATFENIKKDMKKIFKNAELLEEEK